VPLRDGVYVEFSKQFAMAFSHKPIVRGIEFSLIEMYFATERLCGDRAL